MVEITTEWIKQWPDDESSWRMRFHSLSDLEGTSDNEIEAAADAFLKARERTKDTHTPFHQMRSLLHGFTSNAVFGWITYRP